MKRMVLGFLVLSLISFSPVFAGKLKKDVSVNGDAQTEGVKGVATVKKSIQATDKMAEDVSKNVDKTTLFDDGVEQPIKE